MTEQQKWEAVARSDGRFDGTLFYAVKSTGIFCRPSCKSKRPRRENVSFFEAASAAQQAGYRPCRRCRPDLPVYEPERELAERVKRLTDEAILGGREIGNALDALGISRRRLAEVFKSRYGMSVREYIDAARLEQAKHMLRECREPVIEVAFAAGFESVSSFYRFFKRCVGVSPMAYRRAEEEKR